jgi:hypothetical protein
MSGNLIGENPVTAGLDVYLSQLQEKMENMEEPSVTCLSYRSRLIVQVVKNSGKHRNIIKQILYGMKYSNKASRYLYFKTS